MEWNAMEWKSVAIDQIVFRYTTAQRLGMQNQSLKFASKSDRWKNLKSWPL